MRLLASISVLVIGGLGWARAQSDSSYPDPQSFQATQETLMQSFSALVAKGATPTQIQVWQQQHAPLLALQQQRAATIGAELYLEPEPVEAAANIPAHASQALKDFLTTQVELTNARAQIHNQLLSALPENVTAAQISQMQDSEQKLFQQQEGANLQLQAQRVQILAAESASQPVSVPPPLALPPGISSQLAALLTAKDQLMRDQLTFSNQYVTATPAARDAAMQQWMQQNAGRFQRLQQLAQTLSQQTTSQN